MSVIKTVSGDQIISPDVIENTPHGYAAVSKIFRVLKLGGWVINTPNLAFIKNTFMSIRPFHFHLSTE